MLTWQIVTRINFAIVAKAFTERVCVRRVVSSNYKNDAAIVNLCSREYCQCSRKLLKEDALFPLYRGMFRDYGDWRVILIRYVFSHGTTRHGMARSLKGPKVAGEKSMPKYAAGCGAERRADCDRGYIKEKRRQWRTYGTTFRYLSERTRIGGDAITSLQEL